MPRKIFFGKWYNTHMANSLNSASSLAPATEEVFLDECNILWIVNYDETNGAIFMQMKHENTKFYATGMTLPVNTGAFYSLKGYWIEGKRGKIFHFKELEMLLPRKKKMAVEFLSFNGFCPGVSKKIATSIVDTLGDDAINIIKTNPNSLDGIKGIGNALKNKIADAISNVVEVEKVFKYLYQFGINAHDSFTLFCKYGTDTIGTVCTNPYAVAKENDDIYPFATADIIALRHGLDPYAPFRLRAGITEAMKEGTQDGHSFLTLPELVRRTSSLLMKLRQDVVKQKLDDAIETTIYVLIEEGSIINDATKESDRLYLVEYYEAEKIVAENVIRIASSSPLAVAPYPTSVNYFSKEQEDAIEGILLSSFSILTGGPGTGKTTVMAEIVKRLQMEGYRVLLGAPTAKAADRMKETTGIDASTIQRLLGFRPYGGYVYNVTNPLKADVVIIDEFSMVDIILMRDLVSAIASGTSFIAIGDCDQLPSVGAGNVLADLISSKLFSVFQLTKIFRQKDGSSIAENAQAINHGLPITPSSDFFLQWCAPNDIKERLNDIVFNKIPSYTYIPSSEIRVITPLKEGERGSISFSNFLREGFNPDNGQMSFMGFRIGDRVMQVKNNYKLGAMNGDEGEVESIDREKNTLTVYFKNGSRIAYHRKDIKEGLELSYVITVHKSQGSEYSAVVIVLPPESASMMNRRLLYTAVTRAKKFVVILGSAEVAALSINKNTEVRRNSTLRERLEQLSVN